MKNVFIVVLLAALMVSCSLADAIDQDPPNNLVPENVVRSEEDARAVLNGAYSKIISFSSSFYYMHSELIPSALIGTMSQSGFTANDRQFADNDIFSDNSLVNNFWIIFYGVIDATNNAIVLTEALPESEISQATKTEIIGEARFVRAMATFDALRYFGQFFDVNSSLGVVLRTEPVNFTTRSKERSTVMESYNQILSDLDFAIANAPDFTVTFRGSKTSAKALKAKVLLFMGRYAEAATLADEVITEGTRTLEATFANAFDNGLTSSEMIFMTHRAADSDEEDNNRKRFYTGRTGNTWYPDLMEGDPRQPLTYSGTRILKTNNEATFRPTYFLRLAEIYLIKAEALAMSGADLATSKAPLDIIRNRAGLENSDAADIDALKDAIFEEYIKELAFENGSDWFAAIRFDKAMTLKPTITSTNQYILPLPDNEIEGNALLTLADQNPGYQ
ncbi:RagB/SusD family nutrient uptake outer membrane protein [Ascidiimonas aurantiaca]|uniref:RagB/SusD family nutrient uptake outer membrane protein n=1 Tax=Ascidiimonas aurantiaca TaxID=1685432 RepID=UPI0030EF721E